MLLVNELVISSPSLAFIVVTKEMFIVQKRTRVTVYLKAEVLLEVFTSACNRTDYIVLPFIGAMWSIWNPSHIL